MVHKNCETYTTKCWPYTTKCFSSVYKWCEPITITTRNFFVILVILSSSSTYLMFLYSKKENCYANATISYINILTIQTFWYRYLQQSNLWWYNSPEPWVIDFWLTSCTRLHIDLFTAGNNIRPIWEELSCIVKNDCLFHFQTVHAFFHKKTVFA